MCSYASPQSKRLTVRVATPLHLAAEKGQNAVIDVLIDAGADPTARDFDGNTPFDLRIGPSEKTWTDLEESMKQRELQVARWRADITREGDF